MPVKVNLEWPAEVREDGSRAWNRVKAPIRYSKRGNMFVKHDGKIFVFENMKEGTPVVRHVDGQWREVGRIVYYTVFLGGKEEQSYEEYLRSPEGRAAAEELMRSLRTGRA